MEEKNSIKEYFKGKNIFITGGTGFLGKALIEKLLRSCPDLNKIYVLTRPKRGKDLDERINDIISSPVFSLLKTTCPENTKKIIPIAGDVKELGLGLSNENRLLLKEQIHVFFHAAASVRFNDFLKDAIFSNLRSAREIALLALDMKQLDVFMHISTTYCNIDNKKIVEEKIYPPHGNWKEIIMIAENCDTNILNELSRKFIGGLPNTYTYTKQLAEHCINDLLKGKVPTIIYRPSVVVSSVVDPFQGWIDNFNGPVGIMVAMNLGILRLLYNDPQVALDYAPVDFVVKSMLVATWYKATSGNKNNIDVFHGSTNKIMPTSFDQQRKIANKISWLLPSKKSIWFPSFQMTKCWYYYYICFIIFQIIPAIFLDLAIKIAGHKPMIVKIQKKMYLSICALETFLMNEWVFINTNTFSLINQIPKEDMHEFNFAIFPSNENQFMGYIVSASLQVSKNLLKDDQNSNISYERRLRMYCLDKICSSIFYGFLIWLAFFKYNIAIFFWEIFYNYLYHL